MNAVKTWMTARWAAFVAAGLTAVALAFVLGTPSDSAAVSGCGTGYRYYNNANHDEEIGSRGRTPEACGCTLDFWGVTSPHYELFATSC